MAQRARGGRTTPASAKRADATAIIQGLRRIVKALYTYSQEVRKAYGLTGPQLWALKTLHRNGRMSIGQLAAALAVHQSSASLLMNRLEKQGHVRLKERHVLEPTDVGQIDLLSLLRSGIPIELPGGRRLMVGVVRPDSPWRNRALGDGGMLDDDTRIFAIIRGEHMMVPRSETIVEAGDRLILVTTAEGLARLNLHRDTW